MSGSVKRRSVRSVWNKIIHLNLRRGLLQRAADIGYGYDL